MPIKPAHRRVATPLLACLLGMILAGGGRAEETKAVQGYTGEWLIVPTDGEPGCRVKLTARHGATAEPDCKTHLPTLAGASYWREIDKGLAIHDAKRKRLMEFRETAASTLRSVDEKAPGHLMVRAKVGVDRAPRASALLGDWMMRRPNGQVVCRLSFQDRRLADRDERYGLAFDGACDSGIRKMNLVSWRTEDFGLVLDGADGSLRFDPASFGFEKTREQGGLLLLLMRPK